MPKIQETPRTISVLLCMYSPVQINTSPLPPTLALTVPWPPPSSWHSFQMRRELDSRSNLPVASFKQLQEGSTGAGCTPNCIPDLEEEDGIRLAGMRHLLCAGSQGCQRWAWGFMVSERRYPALADNEELKSRPDHKDSF